MHADVDEGTEMSDVGDDAFQDHTGLQVFHAIDAVIEVDDAELAARISPWFAELGDNVDDRRNAELVVDEFLGLQFAAERRIADQ